MEEKIARVRSEEIRVKFQPDMKKRVDRIAALHGTPAATWCHHAIAQAVVAFERQMQLQNKTAESMAQAMLQSFGPEILKAIESAQLLEDSDVTSAHGADGAEGGVKG